MLRRLRLKNFPREQHKILAVESLSTSTTWPISLLYSKNSGEKLSGGSCSEDLLAIFEIQSFH